MLQRFLDSCLIFVGGVIFQDMEVVFREECMYFVEIIVFAYYYHGFALISLGDHCIFR
jgi:hypothetical protein